MLAKAQVELHLLHYGLIMVSCKSYMNGLALIKLHTVLLWQPQSPKGKFFTDIPTLTEETVAEWAEMKGYNIKLWHDEENGSELCSFAPWNVPFLRVLN